MDMNIYGKVVLNSLRCSSKEKKTIQVYALSLFRPKTEKHADDYDFIIYFWETVCYLKSSFYVFYLEGLEKSMLFLLD